MHTKVRRYLGIPTWVLRILLCTRTQTLPRCTSPTTACIGAWFTIRTARSESIFVYIFYTARAFFFPFFFFSNCSIRRLTWSNYNSKFRRRPRHVETTLFLDICSTRYTYTRRYGIILLYALLYILCITTTRVQYGRVSSIHRDGNIQWILFAIICIHIILSRNRQTVRCSW